MVVPEISLANTTFSFDLSILFNNMAIDMEVDTSRGWSTSTSTNSSRATSVHSNISSTGYTEHIQALANNLTWADQVEISKSEGPALSYMSPKVGETNIANEATALETVLEPHDTNIDNMSDLQRLEPFTILYSANPPGDPQLWDGSFLPHFLSRNQ